MFSTLITTNQWIERSRKANWALFDCHFDLTNPDSGVRAYKKAHIPGAQYAHLEQDLSGPAGPHTGRHPLPDPETFATKLSAWGVGPDTQVVCYDNAGGAVAARMWWLLRWLGHEAVAVLEGGWRLWTKAGHPVSTEIPQPSPAHFSPRPQKDRIITTEELEGLLENRYFRILDARSEERFNGEFEPLDPVAGHVPGAISAPYWDNLDPWDHFLSPQALHTYYKDVLKGSDPQHTAVMCGSGVTACHTLLAMEVAGLPGAKLYVGSWSEWIRDPARPVAQGTTEPE